MGDSQEERLPDRETQVALTELGDSTIGWQVRVWCDAGDYCPLKDKLTRDAKYALDQAGIGIPFPQMDVHLISAEEDAA